MEIKLSTNGWHRRLQKYVFGNPPIFYNFCPYFWLTNFCILVTFIIPVVPIVKSIYAIIKWLEKGFDIMADWLEKSVCMPAFEAKSKRMSMEEVINAWFFNTKDNVSSTNPELLKELYFWQSEILHVDPYYTPNKVREGYIKKFDAWKKTTPNWEKLLTDYKEKRKASYEEYLKNKDRIEAERTAAHLKTINDEKQAKIRKANAYNAIIKYTKWIGYILATATILFCLYWIFIFIRFTSIYIMEHFYFNKFVMIMKQVGWVLLGLIVLFCIIYLLVKLISKIPCNICFCNSKFSKFWSIVGNGILDGIIWLCIRIGGFFKFFWTYIVAVKKDYCPGINWDEEK